MIAGMTYYNIFWYFLIYSFAGWMVEVAFFALETGNVVNRGFLNGPVCPVYGFGMLSVFAAGNLLEKTTAKAGLVFSMQGNGWDDILVLFIGGVILTTLVELIAGWALDKLFHTRWWDYRDRRHNFHGYICFEFSLIWGLGVVLVVRVLHPIIQNQSMAAMPEKYGWPVLAVLYALYAFDLVLAVMTIIGLNKKLAELDRMRNSMRRVSNALSESIADTTITTVQVVQEGQVQAALGKAEVKEVLAAGKDKAVGAVYAGKDKAVGAVAAGKDKAVEAVAAGKDKAVGAVTAGKDKAVGAVTAGRDELEATYRAAKSKLAKATHLGAGRLLKAFPNMMSEDYNEMLKELKDMVSGKDENE